MTKRNIIITAVAGIIIGAIAVFFGLKAAAMTAFLALAIAAVFLSYERVTYLIGAYVFFDFFTRSYIGGFVASIWDEALFIVFFLVWIYKWIIENKHRDIRTTPIDGALILFYGVSIILLLVNTIDMRIGIEGFRSVVQHTLWYFITSQLLKDKFNDRKLHKLLVLVGIIISIHGIYQYIIKVEMPPNWVDSVETGISTRVYSIIGSPNILGSFMTLLIPMCFALFFAEKKPVTKTIFLFSAGLMMLCLVFTYSRGAWLGFLAAMFVYIIMKDKRLIVPAIVVLLLVIVFVPSISSRLLYMISPEYLESSLRGGRLVRWIEGLEIVKARPFVGVGHGMFGGAVAMNNEIRDTFYMDNYYLKTAVEMGIIGLVSFLILMYQVAIWNLRASIRIVEPYYKELAAGAFAGLVGVIVHNFVENVFEVPTMVAYFWVVCAIVMHLFGSVELKTKKTGD